MTGQELQQLIDRHGLTQAQFAKLIKSTRESVNRYVNGKRRITYLMEMGMLCLLHHRSRKRNKGQRTHSRGRR